MLKALLRDPIVRIVVGIWLLISVFYIVPIVPRPWLDTYSDAYVDLPFAPWIVIACWIGLRDIHGRQERRFWILLGASFVAWLAVSLPYAFFPETFAWDMYADLTFLLVYLFQILALDMRPHHQHTDTFREREQQLRSIGVILIGFFWLCYFVLVPAGFAVQAYRSSIPSFYLYIAFDLVIFGRLIWLRRETWSVRWTWIYTWLAAGAFLFTLSDIVELAYTARGVDLPKGTWLDALWTVPLVLYVVGIRARHVPFFPEQRVLNETPPAPEPLRAGHVLMLGAFSLPLLHYIIDAAGLLDKSTEPLREVVAITSMVVLGGLSLLAYRVLERERANMEAQQARLSSELGVARKMDAVARLAAAVAHDFNNLVQVIRGRSELISDRINASDPLQDDVREIRAAAARATDLASELMAFGRTQPTSPSTVSLHDLLRECEQLIKPLLDEQTTVRLRLNAAADIVRVDPLQFERIILNLGMNARDAMPNGGVLTLETRNPAAGKFDGQPTLDRSQVTLVVSDTGGGMTPEIIEHIFEPFYTTKPGRGSGLGLAIVHGLVRQFSGVITVDSVLGQGTTFTMTFPVAKGSAHPVGESSGASLLPAAVIIIDADATNRQLLRRLLADLKRPVLMSASESEALQVAAQYKGPVGVAIVDVTAEGGRTAAAALRESHPGLRAVLLAQDQPLQPDAKDIVLREPFELADVLTAATGLLT